MSAPLPPPRLDGFMIIDTTPAMFWANFARHHPSAQDDEGSAAMWCAKNAVACWNGGELGW